MNIVKTFIIWFRGGKKSGITVLDILKFANMHRESGLCLSFDNACTHYKVDYTDFTSKCKLFTREAAVPFGSTNNLWWWPVDEWETGRAAFLSFLISHYSSKYPIYLKSL